MAVVRVRTKNLLKIAFSNCYKINVIFSLFHLKDTVMDEAMVAMEDGEEVMVDIDTEITIGRLILFNVI